MYGESLSLISCARMAVREVSAVRSADRCASQSEWLIHLNNTAKLICKEAEN